MTKAVILAAGEGSRLRPLTNDRPKCMVEVNGKALLDYQLEAFNETGVQPVHVVTGYKHERVVRDGIHLHHNPRFASTNMVYTLFRAADVFDGESDVIISYGDIAYNVDVLQQLIACTAPIGVIADSSWRAYWEARMEDPFSDAETFRINDGNRIIELGRKPNSYSDIQGQYIGLIKIRADHAKAFVTAWQSMDQTAHYDGKDFENMYMTSFLQHLINNGWDLRAEFVDNGWIEIDSPEDLVVDIGRFLGK